MTKHAININTTRNIKHTKHAIKAFELHTLKQSMERDHNVKQLYNN